MSNDQKEPEEQNEAIEELKSKIEQLESSNSALNRQVL
jgi:prefoldin subunit 5